MYLFLTLELMGAIAYSVFFLCVIINGAIGEIEFVSVFFLHYFFRLLFFFSTFKNFQLKFELELISLNLKMSFQLNDD